MQLLHQRVVELFEFPILLRREEMIEAAVGLFDSFGSLGNLLLPGEKLEFEMRVDLRHIWFPALIHGCLRHFQPPPGPGHSHLRVQAAQFPRADFFLVKREQIRLFEMLEIVLLGEQVREFLEEQIDFID
jgi:hypothetical protein